MARAEIELDRPHDAISVLRDVEETLLPIVEADQNNTTYQYDLGFAYRLSAQAFHKKNEDGKAIEFVEKAITIFEKLRELNALRESDKNLLAELEQEKAEYVRR